MREGLALTIDPNGKIVLDKTEVKLADLGPALEAKGAASRPVYLRADQRVPYGVVAQVIGRARAAGVTQLGLVTEPDERLRP
jgi:biopolymer transport protein ExbD